MNDISHSVRVQLQCAGHSHELCVTVGRGVPPRLRCEAGQGPGYGTGGGGGCRIPPDLAEQVSRQLRDSLQDCIRRGYVLIQA
ncbi:hypothetical protein EV643_14117 [Kribbella sp. VKM Ac-2527]|uniref:Uncharacterized protein n=1 Tax=Kribbella caucasensis TaxID=2512215 RepID=A0A4R6J3U2_9ACTN|nr:hypothetical protein [Kribbella sp. VKM Ac-2527]TDO30042.1 hypothetical protein EV643_14117 [Kribbella sp. VKM Ac-2527]